jgi:hypothetical protein
MSDEGNTPAWILEACEGVVLDEVRGKRLGSLWPNIVAIETAAVTIGMWHQIHSLDIHQCLVVAQHQGKLGGPNDRDAIDAQAAGVSHVTTKACMLTKGV